jgi:hypothetical protein
LNDLIADLQLFSLALTKLGWVKQSQEVDLLTSNLLFGLKVEASAEETNQYYRKALLIKAKALLGQLQVELGDIHPTCHTMALISYEIKNEIELT